VPGGPAHRKVNIIMVNNNGTKKVVRRPKAKPVNTGMVVGEKHTEDDVDYWTVTAPNGDEFHIGQDIDTQDWLVYDPDGETGWEHLRGFSGYSDRKVMLRHLLAYTMDEDTIPVPTGKRDPWNKECVLVPVDQAPSHPKFLLMGKGMNDHGAKTYYRFDKTTNRVRSMVTVDCKGLQIGWDMCGVCHSRIHRCLCASGASMPRGVVWCIYGAAHGWDGTNPEYPGGRSNGKGSASAPVTRTATRPVAAPTPAPVVPVTPKPVEAVRKAPKAADAMVAALDAGDLDLGDLGRAAEAANEAAIKSTRKVIRRKKK
jgi:hypothetical protein